MYGKYQRYNILHGLNLPPEFEGGELRGFTFLYRMLDTVFPILFILCLITLLSDVFTRTYQDGMDLEDLFPVNRMTWQLDKVAKLLLISLCIYGLTFGVIFTLAGLLNGFSSSLYPISLYTEHYTDTIRVGRLIGQTLVLHTLTILMTLVWVDLMALMTKDKLTTLFVSAVTLLGGILLTGNIAPLAKILHLFPTTYFFATRVITQQLAYENVNPEINYINGLLVLVGTNLLLIVCVLWKKSWSKSI